MQKNIFFEKLPPDFVRRMQSELGQDYPLFEESLQQKPPVSIRYNPFKSESILASGTKIDWSELGYYLPERPVFTLDPLFHAGVYYVQEASSMLLGNVFKKVFPNPKGMRVLDMCAAPGGKSTDLLSNLIGEDNILICNEVVKKRVPILMENLQKWGCSNVFVCSDEPQKIAQCGSVFHAVVIDAPCSGEGLFRKDPNAISEWSPQNLTLCENRQKGILDAAYNLLEEGGYLFYSTCTFNPLENEANVHYLIEKYEMEEIKFDFPAEWGIATKKLGYQCYPHRVGGEGFYLAVLKKNETESSQKSMRQKTNFVSIDWMNAKTQWQLVPQKENDFYMVNAKYSDFFQQISKKIRLYPTLTISKIKNEYLPSHSLALSNELSDDIPQIELSLNDSLRFLKKETFDFQPQRKGWHLVTYRQKRLGWVKALENRVNNYLPKEFRIRMNVDYE